ncbi:hypothetical protein KIL84_013062 [Mauremys mutica]|uniref:Uncharacterized protein n=1 Tax=Mauremys mutica TaxID=74926 RepID=A0A9D3XTA9_9SAUR|nr:hypothetical protein KIL84_013062 [Mauremys mutica]
MVYQADYLNGRSLSEGSKNTLQSVDNGCDARMHSFLRQQRANLFHFHACRLCLESSCMQARSPVIIICGEYRDSKTCLQQSLKSRSKLGCLMGGGVFLVKTQKNCTQ